MEREGREELIRMLSNPREIKVPSRAEVEKQLEEAMRTPGSLLTREALEDSGDDFEL